MGRLQGSAVEMCYLVNDLDEAMIRWSSDLRAGPFFLMTGLKFEEVNYRGRPDHGSFIGALGFLGSTLIELIQTSDEQPSIYREVLEQRGEGFHHIYPQMRQLSSAEYDAEYARYRGLGFDPVLHLKVLGMRNAFFDARTRLGCFVEILEINEVALGIIDRMYGAHMDWDGKRPVRDLEQVL